jgi:hypothetical protein
MCDSVIVPTLSSYSSAIMSATFVFQSITLRSTDHHFTHEYYPPDLCPKAAVRQNVRAWTTCLMMLEMLVQAQIFAHLDALNDCRPGAIVVSLSSYSFASLEYHEQSLQGAQPWSVHEII